MASENKVDRFRWLAALHRLQWRGLLFLLKVGFSSLAIWYAVRTIDLSNSWHHIASQNLLLLTTAAILMLLQIALGASRWHIILDRLDASPRASETFRLYYIGAFFNYCVWRGAVSGDVIRAWLSTMSSGNVRASVNSVILDRVAMLASMAILVLVTTQFLIV